MKWIKKCPMFILLVISGVAFTIAGAAGKNSIYKEYKYNVITTPLLALTMEGISKKEFAFNELALKGDEAAADVMADVEMQPELLEEVEAPAEEAISDIPKEEKEEAENQTYDFETVTEDYFNDAVFIGDSRTVGLFEYAGMEERADFFAKISLTIYDVFTAPIVKDEETGGKITVEEALQKKQYKKVYLMLGINELGTGTTETFMKEYSKVVARLKELQPEAVIFVQGIMRVTGSKNETDPIFNNTNINDRNSEIAKLADNSDIFYIDVNEVVCDEKGDLNTEYTIDEIHLKAQHYVIWKQFLLDHGIVRK